MSSLTLTVCLGLLALSTPPGVDSSSAEVTQDDSTGELIISVVSSRPETTFSGRVGLRTTIGYMAGVQMEFSPGQEFCLFTPVLGMRNFTCNIIGIKYWDVDTEVEISDSEGSVIAASKLVAKGKRSPTATVQYNRIPRPDIVQVCVRNAGASKTLKILLLLTDDDAIEKFITTHTELGESHNVSAEALIRMKNQFSTIIGETSNSGSLIRQDFFRLLNINSWVNVRGTASSLAMVFCSGLSTIIIRRWFRSPRSTV